MTKSEQSARDSMRGAYGKMRIAADKLVWLTSNRMLDCMEGTDIADMRDEVETINQRFHEFSAYWNVVNTE